MGGHTLIDLTSTFGADLHEMLREAARQGPLATDEITGSKVVLRQHDVEALAHDPRLEGIGPTLFDLIGITDGPLRDWYGRLMFTTEGDYHRRTRSLAGLHAPVGRRTTFDGHGHGRDCRGRSPGRRRPPLGLVGGDPVDLPAARSSRR